MNDGARGWPPRRPGSSSPACARAVRAPRIDRSSCQTATCGRPAGRAAVVGVPAAVRYIGRFSSATMAAAMGSGSSVGSGRTATAAAERQSGPQLSVAVRQAGDSGTPPSAAATGAKPRRRPRRSSPARHPARWRPPPRGGRGGACRGRGRWRAPCPCRSRRWPSRPGTRPPASPALASRSHPSADRVGEVLAHELERGAARARAAARPDAGRSPPRGRARRRPGRSSP